MSAEKFGKFLRGGFILRYLEISDIRPVASWEKRMRSRWFCVAAVVLLGAVAGGAQIHGRDGITLPNPPAVKTDPVVDEYKSTDPNVPTKITDPVSLAGGRA